MEVPCTSTSYMVECREIDKKNNLNTYCPLYLTACFTFGLFFKIGRYSHKYL